MSEKDEQEERKVPEKIRLQRDSVDANGNQVRKGETVEVNDEAGNWPEHRAMRHIDKEFAVDANDPDLEENVATFDDASRMKRRGHKAGKKKR